MSNVSNNLGGSVAAYSESNVSQTNGGEHKSASNISGKTIGTPQRKKKTPEKTKRKQKTKRKKKKKRKKRK